MTDRVKRMVESLRINQYPLCVEFLRLANESLDETAGEPMITRRSKLHAHILDNMTIFIEPEDLLCGSGASKPFGLEMQYEYGVWTKDEVESLKSEIYTISPEDEAELYQLNERFANNAANSNLTNELVKSLGMNDRMWPFMKAGLVIPPWKERTGGAGGGYAMSGYGLGPGQTLICIDYSKILKGGAKAIIEEAKYYLDNLRYEEPDIMEKRAFWEGTIMVFEAWVRLANRYADLAEKMASEEKGEKRKAELTEMARICRKVPYNPPETFREALQAFWFTFLMALPSPTTAAGRFDQYMYPFYKADIEAGRITDEEVLELLEIMRCKVMKINRVSGKANRTKNSGMAKWYNWTIGGVKEDGTDASNELTYLLLDAAIETHLPHHTLTLRVHKGTPDKLMVKALECVRGGSGMPAFVGDESYINFFTKMSDNNKLSVEEARDWVCTGCVDGNVQGLTRTQVAIFFIIPQAMDIALHNGYCRFTGDDFGKKVGDVKEMKTFEEVKEAVFDEIRYMMRMANERSNVELIAQRDLFPDVFRSALMKDGVKIGKDLFSRHFEFENGAVLGAVGGVNTGNALYAIKTLVFDQKKYTMAQLMEALDADWVGYDEMRADFLAAPKYGNNVPEVDFLVNEIYKLHADTCYSLPCVYGDSLKPNAISISAHQPGGMITPATADGRKGGTILADASLSPTQGSDTNGPLAVFNSAMRVNQDAYQGTLMNMKFDPSNMKTEDDLVKLGSMIKTYLTHGGKHIQFTVANTDDMRDAKVHPENHSELIVRVAGYSAYFTRLTPMVQQEIIDRTSQTL